MKRLPNHKEEAGQHLHSASTASGHRAARRRRGGAALAARTNDEELPEQPARPRAAGRVRRRGDQAPAALRFKTSAALRRRVFETVRELEMAEAGIPAIPPVRERPGGAALVVVGLPAAAADRRESALFGEHRERRRLAASAPRHGDLRPAAPAGLRPVVGVWPAAAERLGGVTCSTAEEGGTARVLPFFGAT